MPTRLRDPQNIRAAYAVAHNRFCLAIHELQADDPFSIILEYDGNFPQPWSRMEVKRNIAAITAPSTVNRGERPFVAVSDEGDIYFLQQEIIREKISGAGIYSDDADGSGSITGLVYLDGTIHAFGAGGQLYARSATQGWQRQNVSDELIGRRGRFSELAAAGGKTVIAAGTIVPASVDVPATMLDSQRQAIAAGNMDLLLRLSDEIDDWKKQNGGPRVDTGFLLAREGDQWRRLGTGSDRVLRSILVESPDAIWVVGGGGTMLKGNMQDGFRNVAFKGDADLSLMDIVKFRDRIVVASGYELHWFDGHLLSPLKPVLDPSVNGSVPTPLKLQVVDDLLYYFDYKHGVFTFDGNDWTEITIPPHLLEREFKGLPQPGR